MRIAGALLAVAMVAPGSATADHLGDIPWTTMLPPLPDVPAPLEAAVPCGGHPSPTCVDGVIAEMVANWEPLDSSCDARAVFALTYLRTTEAFRTTLGTGFFDDEDVIINLDRVFADLFFDAIDGYEERATPQAWTIAFDASKNGRTNAVQDVFLGMNAHVQRDLPVALSAVGLVQAGGSSWKPDHDRVNEILAVVADDIQDELARLYDPMVTLSDASPSPADEHLSLETVKLWREIAWRNAERLALARSDAERDLVMTQIEAYSATWAQMIAATDFSWYEARRFAYCTAAHQATQP